jgi:hypothetical protein
MVDNQTYQKTKSFAGIHGCRMTIEATSAFKEVTVSRLPHPTDPTHRFSLVSWDPVFILSQIEAI